MAVTLDMLTTWRHPAAVFRRKLAQGEREDRALATLMGACFLLFVAQWPGLSRKAFLAQQAQTGPDAAPALDALVGSAFFALMFIAPLFFYAIAALSQLLSRLSRRPIHGYAARLALFWALLCTAPLMLFQGLLQGFIGSGTLVQITGVVIFLAFFWLWTRLMREAAQ